METSGVTPHVAVSAPELGALLRQPGPVASVYLTTEADIDNASQKSQLRWKDLRRELAEKGAPETALDAIEPLVPDAHHDGQTLAAVANEHGLLHASSHPDPPARDVGRWDTVAYAAPLVEWRQAVVSHLIVLTDRQGADIVAVRGEEQLEHEQVQGDESFPVHKSKAGGWSQRRYQQRAENTWEKNADDVAKEVTRLADEF